MTPKTHQHAVEVLRQQGSRRIQTEQVAVIDDGNQIAQLLRFVHVVGGEHHRLALGLDRLYSLPEVVARLGSVLWWAHPETAVRDPRAGPEPAAGADAGPGELATVPVDELAQGAQIDEQLPWQGIGVEAGEQAQGIAHRQEILQRRVLELDADAGAIIRAARGAVKQDLAAVRGEDPPAFLWSWSCPPVRAEQAEAAAGGNGKLSPSTALTPGKCLTDRRPR